MLRAAPVAALALLLTAPAAAAQSGPRFFVDTGSVRDEVAGLSRAEAAAVRAATLRIMEVLRANPVVTAPPPGPWCTWVHAATPVFHDSTQGPQAAAELVASDASGRCAALVASGGAIVTANTLEAVFGSPVGGVSGALRDTGGGFVFQPAPLPPLDGFPQYAVSANHSRRIVVLTRRREPLWLPVSRERYLRALIAEYEATVLPGLRRDSAAVGGGGSAYERWMREERPRIVEAQRRTLADLQGQLPPAELEALRANLAEALAAAEAGVRQMSGELAGADATMGAGIGSAEGTLRALHDVLARMSPADRAAQACLDYSRPATAEDPTALTAVCDRGNAVVTPNPRFLDRGRPASALQLLVVQTPAPEGEYGESDPIPPNPFGFGRMVYRLYQTTNFAALAALLD